MCPVFPALAGRFFTTEPLEKLTGTLANYHIFSIHLCWKMTDRFFGVHKVKFYTLYNLSLMSDHPNFGYLRKSSRLNFAFDTESVFKSSQSYLSNLVKISYNMATTGKLTNSQKLFKMFV